MEFPDPYRFVRFVTIALATFWTVTALLRTVRFALRWEVQLAQFGFSRQWYRRQLAIVLIRATVLDPLNLALTFLLFGLWTLGYIVRGSGL